MLAEYCELNNIDKDDVCFNYGDQLILDTDTPKSLGLEYGETLDIYFMSENQTKKIIWLPRLFLNEF